jgi:hypothetical protein
MDTVTKLQKTIITIYAGNAYSAFRDNNLSELQSKTDKYLKKVLKESWSHYGGGCALMIMEKVLSGTWKYGEETLDDTQKKAWLAIALGLELTCWSVKSAPKILLPVVRLFAAPHIKDRNFSTWIAQYKSEVSRYISLIDGLGNLRDDCDIYKIIFEK